jgi:hypothetical protein
MNVKLKKYILLTSVYLALITPSISYAQAILDAANKLIDKNKDNLAKVDNLIDKNNPNAINSNLEEITQGGKKTIILDKEKIVKNINSKNNSKEINSDKKKITKIPDILNKKTKNNKIKSLMLSDKELDEVENAINALIEKKPLKAKVEKSQSTQEATEEVVKVQERSKIYLNAILYISKKNWIAWINGEKITTENNSKSNSIYIKSINNNKANIEWKMGLSKWRVLTGRQNIEEDIYPLNKTTNQVKVNFSIKVNQTYSLIDNKVTEGKK